MQLRELLQDLSELYEAHGDCEVRLMMQPYYPFEYSLAGAAHTDYLEDFVEDDGSEAVPIVYLCEGEQLDYGNARVWDHL